MNKKKLIFDNQKAIEIMYSGGRVTSEELLEKEIVLCFENGQVFDSLGNPYNIFSNNEYFEYIEEKEDTLNDFEAMRALFDGKLIQPKENENVILKVKDNVVIDNNGNAFDIMQSNYKEWILVEEEDNSCSDEVATKADINELRKRLDEINESFKNLSDVTTKALMNTSTTKDGRDTANQGNTNNLIKDVYGVNDGAEVKKLFREELRKAKSNRAVQVAITKFIPYCWIGGRTLGTTSVYYSQLRTIAKEVLNDEFIEMALNLLLPPDGLYEASQKKVTDNTIEKHINRDIFDANEIYGAIDSIKKLILDGKKDINAYKPFKSRQNTLEQVKAYAYFSYLTLVTGRRQIELFKTLSIIKEGNKWFYDGIAKKRDGETGRIKAYSLDEDFEFLQELLTFLQDYLDVKDWDNIAINGKYNHVFNNALKRLTGLNFTSKDIREIVADLLYIIIGKKTGTWNEEKEFKAEVLGHEIKKDRLTASEHYMTKEAK
jgi:tetrahydromethanopterin S-methyltransferase subunit G